MNDKKRTLIIHPILFAPYMVLYLYAHNISQVMVKDIPLPLMLVVVVALVSWVVLGKVIGNYKKSGVFVSTGTVLFFSFGHIHDLVKGWTIFGMSAGSDALLVPVYAIIALALLAFILFRKKSFDLTNSLLNVMSAALVIMSLSSIVIYQIKAPAAERALETAKLEGVDLTAFNQQATKPDVYCIILDGYGSDEVLDSIFHYDNTPFLDSLKQLGFQVPERAFSNYNQTVLALASILDMSLLDHLSENPGENSSDYTIPIGLIKNGKVWRTFRALGYNLNLIRSGWGPTDVNQFIDEASESTRGNEFISMLAHTTIYPVIRRNMKSVGDSMDERLRRHKLQTFVNIEAIPSKPSPNFTLAHIISPHPPYLFGKNGELVDPGEFSLDRAEGNINWLPAEKYVDQTQFLNSKVLHTVRQLIRQSAIEPIILIVGDHGPATLADWNNPSDLFLHERMEILFALKIPGAKDSLPELVSSTNSFGYIFNEQFDAKMDILPDIIHHCTFLNPYRHFDVSERLMGGSVADSVKKQQ